MLGYALCCLLVSYRPLATLRERPPQESLRASQNLAAASVLDTLVAALHREQRPRAAGHFPQLHQITPSCRSSAALTRVSEMSADDPVTWSQKADDDQANATDAISEAEARLEMVGRGPMSPPKDSRPRDDPKSGNPAPRKPGGAGFDGTVVTEDGATAEVPKHMEHDVGGRTLFDNVSNDDEKESE